MAIMQVATKAAEKRPTVTGNPGLFERGCLLKSVEGEIVGTSAWVMAGRSVGEVALDVDVETTTLVTWG